MSIIKFVNAKNRQLSQLKRSIDYILDSAKAPLGFIAQTGLSAESAYEDMVTIKVLFDKITGRQYVHFIVSFDKGTAYFEAYRVGLEILPYFRRRYQVLMSTHTNTENPHLHFILNSVGSDGYKFRQSRRELAEFKNFVNQILLSHGMNPVGKIGRLHEDDWIEGWENDEEDYFEDFEDFQNDGDYEEGFEITSKEQRFSPIVFEKKPLYRPMWIEEPQRFKPIWFETDLEDSFKTFQNKNFSGKEDDCNGNDDVGC